MNSNSFHNFINFYVVHYFFKLMRRITTINNKIYVIEFNCFIKFFLYSIQNRDINITFIILTNYTTKIDITIFFYIF